MKTYSKFLLLLMACCSVAYTQAQVPCGVTAQAGSFINPNHVYQFVDSSMFAQGWQSTSTYWSFGDGTTSSQQNPTHVYNSPGIYTVCLYETAQLSGSASQCTDTSCITVDYCQGMVVATYNFSIHGDTVTFNGAASGNYPPFSYHWSFGDGSPNVTGASPVHVFPGQGTYHVCMQATDANGCLGYYCQDVTIVNTACAGIHPAFTYQTSPGTIILQSTSTGTHISTQYQWTMDGAAISNINPNTSFTYSNINPGTHLFCLKLYAANSTPPYLCTDTCMHITIPGNTSCGVAGLNYYTTNTGSIHAYSTSTGVDSNNLYTWYIWNSNGNLVQTQSGAANHFASQNLPSGTYQVCLYLYGANQTFCDSACITAVVNLCPITPAWAYAIHSNDTVVFELADTNSTANHYLSFGDGTSGSGTHQTHVYANPGTYTVCSYVYIPNTNCVDSLCQTITVSNTNPCNVSAGFQFTFTGGTVAFSGNANPNGAVYHWNFGDNTDTTSTSHYVTHHYPSDTTAHVYHVCLTVTISGTICADTFCQYVTVPASGGNTGCHAQFSWSFVPSNYLTIYFTNQSNTANTNATYLWTFGDGTSSTNFDPHHTYSSPGVYGVCLTVSTFNGCTSTYCDSVVVGSNTGGGCHANFNWIYSTNANGGIVFNNLSTGGTGSVVSWVWSFGDGDSSTAFSPTHQYANNGLYNVCLTMTTANGCTSTFCDSVQVGQNSGICQAQFAWYQMSSNCGTVQFSNTSTGNYTGAYWSFGDGSSSQLLNPDHHYSSPGTYTVVLTIFGGTCQISYTHVITVVPCNNVNDTICGIVFNDLNNNGILDGNETVIAGAQVHIGNHVVTTDSNGHYVFITTAGNYSVYATGQSGCIATVPLTPNSNVNQNGGSYYIHGANGGTFCGYNFGFNCNVVHVCGVVYYDANGNGVQDSTESGIPNVHVMITGTNGAPAHNAYTNANGEYCVTLLGDLYTVTISANNYQSCAVAPTNISVAATTPGTYYSGNNFGINCPPGNCNLSINVTPHTTVTAGYPAWYSIQVCNIGTSVSAGTVNMFYPNTLIFNTASPVQSSINTSTHTVTWNMGSLLPGQCAYYWVTFNADPSTAVGTPAFTLVNVIPDANCNDIDFVNNVDTIHQAYTASWDPNNKLAYVTNYDNSQYQLVSSIEPNQRIEYVINFQNEGNAPAVNVVVNDLISTDLDMSSFEMLGSSHPCIVTSNGNEVNFKFSDIMLPYATADEPGSHGFVRFAINSVNGLAAGHVISDGAAIYFDYNSPVMTNDAEVILLEPSGVDKLVVNPTVVIAPNPMSQYAVIKLDSKTEGFRFRVTDMTGRVVAEKMAANNSLQFDRNSIAAGVYLYQVIQNNKPVAQGKLVIE